MTFLWFLWVFRRQFTIIYMHRRISILKINFITYSAAVNYGAMLQTYGLYSFLKSQDNEVEVINYIQDRYDFDNPDYEKNSGNNKFLET